jgi:hypothetical protein
LRPLSPFLGREFLEVECGRREEELPKSSGKQLKICSWAVVSQKKKFGIGQIFKTAFPLFWLQLLASHGIWKRMDVAKTESKVTAFRRGVQIPCFFV